MNVNALQHLEVHGSRRQALLWLNLSGLTALTYLQLKAVRMLDGLHALHALRRLCLSRIFMFGPAITRYEWSRHPHHTALNLSSASLNAVPQQLALLSGLARLDLSFHAMGDAGVAALGSLRQLTWLSLMECGLRRLPMVALQLPDLRWVRGWRDGLWFVRVLCP